MELHTERGGACGGGMLVTAFRAPNIMNYMRKRVERVIEGMLVTAFRAPNIWNYIRKRQPGVRANSL